MSGIELSINLERVKHSYYLMSHVARDEMPFNMRCWQSRNFYPALTLGEFREKLNKGSPRIAGYGGYLALSSKFQDNGGVVGRIFGEPIYRGVFGAAALAKWLEVSRHTAELLLCRQETCKSLYIDTSNKQIEIVDVAANMVASALNYLHNYKTLDDFFVKDQLMPDYYK